MFYVPANVMVGHSLVGDVGAPAEFEECADD